MKISVGERSVLKIYQTTEWSDYNDDIQNLFTRLHELKYKQLHWPSLELWSKPIESFQIMKIQPNPLGGKDVKVRNQNFIFKIQVCGLSNENMF